VSANYSDPEPDDQKTPEPAAPPVPVEPAWMEHSSSTRPGQPLREYTSSGGPWAAPSNPLPPPTVAAGYYPPAGPYQQPGWPPYSGQSVQPGWQPAQFPPYQGYTGYPGSVAPGYYAAPGYGYYPWVPPVSRPKRGAYLLTLTITAFACSCLVIMAGLVSIALFALSNIVATDTLSSSDAFSGEMLLLAIGIVSIAGGSFSLYHSIRALFFRKPSGTLQLPRFWIFLLCYLVLLGLGYWLHTQGQDITMPALTGFLIFLCALFPVLTIVALGIRRLRASKTAPAPTTWRRFTLALVSGATLSVALAYVLELLLQNLLLGSQGNEVLQYLNNPNAGSPAPSLYGILLIMLAVIAPLVEETVKPLAVIFLIGRVQSKAEAFALGLACGVGFNLVETTGYISSGYSNWLNVAFIRSGAGLLHGLGAAMVALGWYCLTHKEEGSWRRRILLALGCAAYAVFQHALWNGSWALGLLPGFIGAFYQNWMWTIGPISINADGLINILEMIGILIFFVVMSGRLRPKKDPASALRQSDETASSQPQITVQS
jgi:RsiW-degrading membrane proteinase PrsW (M82 family)